MSRQRLSLHPFPLPHKNSSLPKQLNQNLSYPPGHIRNSYQVDLLSLRTKGTSRHPPSSSLPSPELLPVFLGASHPSLVPLVHEQGLTIPSDRKQQTTLNDGVGKGKSCSCSMSPHLSQGDPKLIPSHIGTQQSNPTRGQGTGLYGARLRSRAHPV